MVGTWLTNLVFALIGFLFVLFVSLPQNTLETSAIRGIIGFVLFFGLAYFIRWGIWFVFFNTGRKELGNEEAEEEPTQAAANSEPSANKNEHSQPKDNDEFGQSNQEATQDDAVKRTSEYVRSLIQDD